MYLTYSRLFIVREARLGLPSTCRGGKGREAGQRCGVGRCEEGGQCGGGWERGRGAHHNASDHGGSSGVSAGAPRWPSTVKKNLLKRLCQSVVSTVHTTGGPAQGPHGSGISSATNCFATARERGFPQPSCSSTRSALRSGRWRGARASVGARPAGRCRGVLFPAELAEPSP